MKSTTKKALLLLGGFIAVDFIMSKAKAAPVGPGGVAMNFDGLIPGYGSAKVDTLKKVFTALIQAGADPYKIGLYIAQVLFETGFFSSVQTLSSQYNNFSGIMYINNPSKQLNASQASPMPGTGYYYAAFNTPLDWAVDYLRILSIRPGEPINADNVQSFAQALKDNGYFSDNLSTYQNGLQHYFEVFYMNTNYISGYLGQ